MASAASGRCIAGSGWKGMLMGAGVACWCADVQLTVVCWLGREVEVQRLACGHSVKQPL
jgi:hypothetical protein